MRAGHADTCQMVSENGRGKQWSQPSGTRHAHAPVTERKRAASGTAECASQYTAYWVSSTTHLATSKHR